jgi:hypothetical protein
VIRLASPLTCRLVNTAAVAKSAAEAKVAPREREPPIAFVVSTFSYCILRPKMIHRVVGTDVDGLAVRNPIADAVVLYDATHGSLRLTEPAYARFEELLARLELAVSMTPDEADIVPSELLKPLREWFESLGPDGADVTEFIRVQREDAGQPGWLQVYKPGSVVWRRGLKGVLHEITLLRPEIVALEEAPQLLYHYSQGGKAAGLVPENVIEAIGDEWSLTYWNPETREYKEAFEEPTVRELDRPIQLSDSVSENEA